MTRRNGRVIPLEYEKPGAPERSVVRDVGVTAAMTGGIGFVLSTILWLMLSSGGPIFPLTVAVAPLAIVWELAYPMPDFLLALIAVGGGTLLYAIYGAAAAWRGRRAVAVSMMFHVTCFLITCELRQAW